MLLALCSCYAKMQQHITNLTALPIHGCSDAKGLYSRLMG